MKLIRICVFVLAAALLCFTPKLAQPAPTDGPERQKANTLMGQGNWAEAYAIYAKLAVAPETDARLVGEDLAQAVQCLGRLNRLHEQDALVEQAVAAHTDNWRLLAQAAEIYQRDTHNGFILSGAFRRGGHRGGGESANAMARDRVRALQLQLKAIGVQRDASDAERASLYMSLAAYVQSGRDNYRSWRLQYLTDLDELPDYEKQYWYYYGGDEAQGAPVDVDGNPVFYVTPQGWNGAANDGERWRWALEEAARLNPTLRNQVSATLADFCYQQYDVRTLGGYGWFYSREEDVTNPGTYALHTLKDNETIARLANGVKRFTLPDEFNYIKRYQELADTDEYKAYATKRLALLYADRRQYDRSADYWRRVPKIEGRDDNLKQILDNWGQFEPVTTQPAGQGATVEYLFRNGTRVNLTAHAIDMNKLLADVRAYLRSTPQQIRSERYDIGDIGARLVQHKQTKYLGKQVASWSQALTPRPGHFDRRITLQTPLKTAGAYLLTAKMADGNTSQIVLWVRPGGGEEDSRQQHTLFRRGCRHRHPGAGRTAELLRLRPAVGRAPARPSRRRLLQGHHKGVHRRHRCAGHAGHPGGEAAELPVDHHRHLRQKDGLPGLCQRVGERVPGVPIQRHESLRDHRPAGLPPRAAGEIQVLGGRGALRRHGSQSV